AEVGGSSRGFVRERAHGLAILVSTCAGDPEAEISQRLDVGGLERHREDATREILVVGQVDVTSALAVDDAVEDADLVSERTLREVAVELHPDVAVRNQILQ